MANFFRMILGVALLPACWAAGRALADTLAKAADSAGGVGVEAVSLVFGMLAFVFCWMAISRPVRAYVLGHELTHALWGLMFGALPSKVRVSADGGSVNLTKSNFLITLAPYFFPFYTFVVIVIGLVTYAFVRPLPALPVWTGLIGFTWAFHVVFTLETLTQRQPDVKLYGRIFSWTFIFVMNVAVVLVWLAATSSVSFAQVGAIVVSRLAGAYMATLSAIWSAGAAVVSLFRKKG